MSSIVAETLSPNEVAEKILQSIPPGPLQRLAMARIAYSNQYTHHILYNFIIELKTEMTEAVKRCQHKINEYLLSPVIRFRVNSDLGDSLTITTVKCDGITSLLPLTENEMIYLEMCAQRMIAGMSMGGLNDFEQQLIERIRTETDQFEKYPLEIFDEYIRAAVQSQVNSLVGQLEDQKTALLQTMGERAGDDDHNDLSRMLFREYVRALCVMIENMRQSQTKILRQPYDLVKPVSRQESRKESRQEYDSVD